MTEKSEFLAIHFNGKNYFSSEFQLRMFLIGKGFWGHIDGTTPKPTSTDAAKYSQWVQNDAKIITWILQSVDQQFFIPLWAHKTAKSI